MNNLLKMGLRIILLTVSLYLIFAVSSLVSGLASTDVNNAAQAAFGLLGVCFAFTVVTSYPVIRSKWSGWPLIIAMFWVIFGIMTFLTQIETIVFLEYLVEIMPPEIIPRLFMQGLLIAGLFSPLLVFVHGKHHKVVAQESRTTEDRLPHNYTEWLWRLFVIALGYIVIYFLFGLLVFTPLAGAAFAEYYSGLQMPGWILPFQAVRAVIWVSVAVPIVQMMKGKWWEAGLAVALLFSVLMGFLLLLPNEFMPPQIRFAHFIEVFSANFVFGWFVVWVITVFKRRRENAVS